MTKGALALRGIVAPPRVNQAEIAEACAVTQQAVSGWLSGRAKPTADRMRVLQDRYGIPMEAWTEAACEGSAGTAVDSKGAA